MQLPESIGKGRRVSAGFGLLAVYLGLTLALIATIMGAAELSSRIAALHHRSLYVMAGWTNRLAHMSDIAHLVTEANAPGNDVFQTKDPDGELVRFESLFGKARAEFAAFARFATNDDAIGDDATLRVALSAADDQLEKMGTYARLVFSAYRQEGSDAAADRMASMDRAHAQVMTALSDIERVLRTAQNDDLSHQSETAARIDEWIGRLWVLAALLTAISVGVGGALLRRFAADARRRAAQVRTIEEKERWLASIIENSADAILVADGAGRIETFNRAAEAMFGRTPHEAVGTGIGALIPSASPADHGGIAAMDERAAEGKRRDGAAFPVVLSVAHVRQNGEMKHIAIIRDDTLRREAEAELRRGRSEAEEAARAKAEFLAAMSHEIRTPMNGVTGTLHLLAATRLDPDQRKYVSVARNSARMLLNLLNDILDVSKLDAGRVSLERVPVSLSQLADGVVSQYGPMAREKGLSLLAETAPGVPEWVVADPTRLHQIATNLVSNAIKFTAKGAVTIRIAYRADGGGARHAEITVTDTGIGISPEACGRIFEKFEQADRSTTRQFGGTGLGLSIVKQLAELMGGRVSVESALGRGSIFRVVIPAEPSGPPAVLEADGAAPAGTGVSLKVLLAEDNAINQMIASAMLKNAGHEVHIVANGREALDAVAAESFDVVLMDAQMPVMDGPSATRAIRALGTPAARVPIVALTANSMPGDREAYLAAGMDDYVAKPIEPSQLFAALARVAGTGTGDLATPASTPPPGPANDAQDDSALDDLLGELDAIETPRRAAI